MMARNSPRPGEELKHQVFLGSECFVEAMRRKLPKDRDFREVPQARPRPAAKPIAYFARAHTDRNSAIAAAYGSGGYTMKDIGDYFGLHYSRVSKIVGQAEREKGKA